MNNACRSAEKQQATCTFTSADNSYMSSNYYLCAKLSIMKQTFLIFILFIIMIHQSSDLGPAGLPSCAFLETMLLARGLETFEETPARELELMSES